MVMATPFGGLLTASPEMRSRCRHDESRTRQRPEHDMPESVILSK
jgi:hypothetical protein